MGILIKNLKKKTAYSHSNSAYDKKKQQLCFINLITMHSCKKENDYHSFKKY